MKTRVTRAALAIAALSLVGCGSDGRFYQTNVQLKAAETKSGEKACADRGGLKTMTIGVMGQSTYICNDGVPAGAGI